MVECSFVNQVFVGSNPTLRAIFIFWLSSQMSIGAILIFQQSLFIWEIVTPFMVVNTEFNLFIVSTIFLRSCFRVFTLSVIILMNSSCFPMVLEITCSMISVQSNEGRRLLSGFPPHIQMFEHFIWY